mgnify:CR=1 FL=1
MTRVTLFALVAFVCLVSFPANAHSDYILKMVKDHLARGGSPNGSIDELNTVLGTAASYGSMPAIKMLIKAGANVNNAGKNGQTPIYIATLFNHFSVVEYLLQNGAKADSRPKKSDPTPLFYAARNGLKDLCTTLKRHGASVNARISGLTLLTMAFNQKDRRAANILLGLGANPNLDKLVFSPLNIAIDLKYYELLPQLLKNGANPNHQSMFGTTALHIAAAKGDGVLCALLLKHGAKATIKDKKGSTAIAYAQRSRKGQLIKLLRGNKTQLNAYLSKSTFRTNLAMNITNGSLLKLTYSGYADKPGLNKKWPFKLRIIKLYPKSGTFRGTIEWTTMGSQHEIVGGIGQSDFHFKEGRVLRKGSAYQGTNHTFSLTTTMNFHPHHLVGLWQNKNEQGSVYLDFTP